MPSALLVAARIGAALLAELPVFAAALMMVPASPALAQSYSFAVGDRLSERKGIADRREPRFGGYVEAVLLCKGAALSTVGGEARTLARSLDASYS